MNRLLSALLIFGANHIYAHEFTPTYPRFEPSYVDGILQTKMKIFNKRNDVEYYELDVYDKDWNPIDFGANEKVFHLSYLETKYLDVYIRKSDSDKVTYICTSSKLIAKKESTTLISSKICSKIK